MAKTVLLFPLVYTVIYLLVYAFASSFIAMVVVVFLWGAIHSGGLIVSQAWLTSETKEAPEFGNSLFVSFSNLGITVGTFIGGLFIAHLGIHQLIWSGVFCTVLAFLLIVMRLKMFRASAEQVEVG